MSWEKGIFVFILSLGFLSLEAQIQKKTPIIQFELYDSSYNFQNTGFTYSTINILTNIGAVNSSYHSASFGAIDMATGTPLLQKTFVNDTNSALGSFCLAFNHYYDNTASIRMNDFEIDGYYIFDNQLDTILNLNDVGIYADNHGIAKLQDGRYAYFADTNQVVNFYSNVIPDSTDWDALAFNIEIFDPVDSSTQKIFDWFSNVDSSFVIPEYLYEGDVSGPIIDWTHPNSIFEDYDGHLLISWRHLGVCKIDVNTGQVFWWLGLPNSLATQQGFNEPTCISGDCRLRLQHDFRAIEGQPNHYTLFDNGDTARDYSRALFFSIDTLNNTMQVEKDPNFDRSDFMGSLALLDNGDYLVNVPTTKRMPFDKFPVWTANGVFQDSVANYIHLLGSDMFLMNANDVLVAKYWSDSGSFVYNNFIIDVTNWPMLSCNEDSVESSSYPSGFNWESDDMENLGTDLRIPANENMLRITFPYGILEGYSPFFDSKDCLPTSSHNLVLENFHLFPNPSKELLYFSDELDQFEIYDLLGRSLLQGKGSFVDVSFLNKGVYLISFTKDGASASAKFSKE